MNTRAFLDDPPPPRPTVRSQIRSHALVGVVVLSVGGIAVGVHTAATALVVIGAGHLVGVGLIAGFVRARRRRSERTSS